MKTDKVLTSLQNVTISGIKYLYNNLSEQEDILSVWISKDDNSWIKIYFEASQCMIEGFQFDESSSDDESISSVDYSHWVIDTIIMSSKIECIDGEEVCLKIILSNNKMIVFSNRHGGKCTIQFLKVQSS
jgi:hypothetical protein